jgi:phosphatidate cytidylyltransferase
MTGEPSHLLLLIVFAALSVALAVERFRPLRFTVPPYLSYLWMFLLAFIVAAWVSFVVAVWLLALFSFRTLREYFSLIDIRVQDRWGLWGAYLSIPFMIYLIQIDWYGLFIISIPVYAFLVVPFLVVLGGRDYRGTVLSIGAIDFGLFLFVFCLGHIGYLLLFSLWWATLLVLGVALCNVIDQLIAREGHPSWQLYLVKFAACAPVTVALSLALSPLTEIPQPHVTALGVLIPILVLVGNYTIRVIECDLGIAPARLEPGRGQIIHGTRSYLFAAPIVFHYIRYYLV